MVRQILAFRLVLGKLVIALKRISCGTHSTSPHAHIVEETLFKDMWVLPTDQLSSLSQKEHFLRFQSQLMRLTALKELRLMQ